MQNISILIGLLAILGSMKLEGQILHYRFTGTVEGNHPDVDFFAEELELSDRRIKIGDKVSGSLIVDPVNGMQISGQDFPPNNQIFGGGLVDIDVEINGESFLASNGRSTMDIGLFNNATTRPPGLEFPLGDDRADALIFVLFTGIPRVGVETVGEDAELFSFMINLTDTSGEVFRGASYPAMIELEQYDLAKGFIRPWSREEISANYGAMFQIDSFELIETLVRPVIAAGPESQIVTAGDNIRLTMAEVRGNQGVKCQWSVNGVDLPGETFPGLTLSNIQASDSGTYRVTAWNNLGTTNVALARIQVIGAKHRLMPLELSGWNSDLIVAEGEDLSEHSSFDGESGKWFAADFGGNPDGFPLSGEISSAGNIDVKYALQPFEQPNVLWLTRGGKHSSSQETNVELTSGILRLENPTKFTALAIAASSGSGGESGELVLHFEDGSFSDRMDYNAADWLTAPERMEPTAIAGLGRFYGESGGESHDSPSNYGFGLYETVIDLVALGFADQTLVSIEFYKPESAWTTGIFAVSGQSAEVATGVYVSWKADSADRPFDVSNSAKGPWMALSNHVPTVENREIAAMDSKLLPRFYRSTVRGFERDLTAHFDFKHEGKDRLSDQSEMEVSDSVEFPDQTMLIPGPGLQARAIIPRLQYNRFTLGFDFFPLELAQTGEQNIVAGGTGFQWIRLYVLDGQLAVSLNHGQELQIFKDVELLLEHWHRIFLSVNVRTGFGQVYFDGRKLQSLDLAENFRYDFTSSTASDRQRALDFAPDEESAPFVGYVDNIMVFRRDLSEEEMLRVNAGLEPKLLTIDFGQESEEASEGVTSGFLVSWESNLEGFELQRSESPLGPWSTLSPLEPSFDGRRVSLIEPHGVSGIFRLSNPR